MYLYFSVCIYIHTHTYIYHILMIFMDQVPEFWKENQTQQLQVKLVNGSGATVVGQSGMYVYVCVYVCVHVCICMHMYVYMYVCMYVYTYVCACMHMCTCMCVCMYTRMRVRMYSMDLSVYGI